MRAAEKSAMMGNRTRERPAVLRGQLPDQDRQHRNEEIMYQIILASASPRRREILERVGIPFTVCVSGSQETRIEAEAPDEMVIRLSREKALETADRAQAPAVVIGADTVVAKGNQILGKPGTADRAVQMLTELSGRTHEVYTGVCAVILHEDGQREVLSFAERSTVAVCAMTREQIEEYAACGEPLDKAGAYAIQGKFALYIDRIEGSYDNIVGLPVSRLYREVLGAGIDLKTGRKNF